MPVSRLALSGASAANFGTSARLIRALTISLTVLACSVSAVAAAAAATAPIDGMPITRTVGIDIHVLSLSAVVPEGTVDQAYKGVLQASGGISPYQYAVASGALPPGVTLSSQTGALTGTPAAAGNYTFAVLVTDRPGPDVGSQTYTITVIRNAPVVGLSMSPSSAMLSSGGTKQFTATVTGTSNTAVTWSATSGSITSAGLYTAPKVKTSTSATITATSKADSAVSSHSAVTVTPAQTTSLQITTSTLPAGQQAENYSAAFAASGGTQPYRWSLPSGMLPPGITLNATGDLAGTPTANGTFAFTARVTDASGITANANLSLSIGTSSGYDGPAQLPIATVQSAVANSPATGPVVTVSSTLNLQTALNAAECGETIQLQAGAAFVGGFTLPAKNCDADQWIVLRTSAPDSALPAEGQRLTPCYAGVSSLPGRPAYTCSNPHNVLAKIEQQAPGDGPIKVAGGANYYRLIGLEITRTTGIKGPGRLVSLLATADHIVVDRSWLHGNAQDETRGGVALDGGTNMAVVDSYFSDFHCISMTGTCTDAHAISGGVSDTQDGPFLIQNNFLEASGEALMFGGGAATKTPTDIEVIGNHFWKPWQWMPGNSPFVGGLDGKPFIVKNHLELKNAARVLVENNLMENTWGGFSQTGFSILLSPKNQYDEQSGKNVCPVCQVTDVTIRYNRLSHAGGGVQIAAALSAGKGAALAGERYSLHDLVIDDLSRKYLGSGNVFEVNNGWHENPLNSVTINHVTAFPDSSTHMMTIGNHVANPQMYGFVFTNNLMVAGRYPVWNAIGNIGGESCAVADVPKTTMATCFTSYQFENNVIIASPANYPPTSWPAQNSFPDTVESVEFVDFNDGNGGNYELQPSSQFKGKASDGKDPGADIVGLQQQLAGVE